MRLLLLSAIVFFMGCSLFQTSPEDAALAEKAKAVTLANTITVTEATQFRELGPIVCRQETTDFGQSSPDELCRNSLRLQAARINGDLVIVEARDTAKCGIEDHMCIYMHGRVYQKLTPTKSSQ